MAEALATYLVQYVGSEILASVIAYAVVITASVVVSKALASQAMGGAFGSEVPNPGSRQQIPPAGDNKLPVVYGSAYVGGIITDLSISENNQELYFVLALSEVTNTETGGTPDEITFGEIYYGGKLVTFESDGYTVASLTDQSTGVVDTTVAGKIQIFLYNNGSYSPTNSTQDAISVMNASGLSYVWDSTKLMSNCAFAIVHLTYSQTASVTSLQQTKFQVVNERTDVGDCIYDYMTSTRYGAAIPVSQIDTASIAALNAYGNEIIPYVGFNGSGKTQARFKFDGAVDTTLDIMKTFQLMASSCDCLIRYNEINAKWAVVVQSPVEVAVMDLNDSNMVSSITVSPMDISNTFNVIECKYPNGAEKDSFSSVTFDLAQIDPALLFPNEPVNKQSLSLYFVNNDVRVQLLANRFLKAAREDLQIQCKIDYSGIQLEAGDIVTVTNANYGWTAKPFRVIKVTEEFLGDGMINASLNLTEYNSSVYDDVSITEFQPADNTGIGDPTFFGSVPAPVVISEYPTNTNPLFLVQATTSSSGITQYAEIWYSAYASPTSSQRIFAGTTAIQSSGNPYDINTAMPTVSLANIPAGNWYFFSRMVNSLASSSFSPASTVFQWRPSTYQFTEQYVAVAYGTSLTGAGFSFSPSGKTYYGLCNQNSISPPTSASAYTWYLADPNFGTANYLCYSNRTGRKFSFDTGLAGWVGNNAAFVPTNALLFDPSIWSALPNGTNIIDLDVRTGQLTQLGFTASGNAAGELTVENNTDGAIRVALKPIQNFTGGSFTGSAANITIDNFGRVVGFEAPDSFYFTKQSFTATAGQTVFSVTRASGYIVGQCLVFSNGCLLDTTEYTDASSSVTLSTGATVGTIITVISVKSVSSTSVTTTGASGTGSVATLTFAERTLIPFQVGQSITVSGVTPTGYNGTYTVTACTNTSVSFASTATGAQTVAGTVIYTNNTYKSLSRNTANLTSASTYTASGFTLNSGFELLFINGTILNELDYNIIGQDITDFPSAMTGKMTIIQWTPDNLGQPNGFPTNIIQFTVVGQTVYPYTYDQNAFDLYSNGVLLLQGTDYTTATGTYVLSNTPDTTSTVMVQQTFARTGAV